MSLPLPGYEGAGAFREGKAGAGGVGPGLGGAGGEQSGRREGDPRLPPRVPGAVKAAQGDTGGGRAATPCHGKGAPASASRRGRAGGAVGGAASPGWGGSVIAAA